VYLTQSQFHKDFETYAAGTTEVTSATVQVVGILASSKGGVAFISVVQMTVFL
jgi:hypothetical protein